WRAQAGQCHYAAAKAGVMALTRCSAIEAAEAGVRINAVSPSLAMHKFLAKVTTEELLAKLTEREAFGRAAEPFEVANVMIFLASDLSSYMTGEVLSVSSQHPWPPLLGAAHAPVTRLSRAAARVAARAEAPPILSPRQQLRTLAAHRPRARAG